MRRVYIFEIIGEDDGHDYRSEFGTFDESMADAMIRVLGYVAGVAQVRSIVCVKMIDAPDAKDVGLFGINIVDQRKQKREVGGDE